MTPVRDARVAERRGGPVPTSVESTMVAAPKTGSQDQWSNGRRNQVTQSGGRTGAAPHSLCRLAVCMSVISASLLSAAGVAVSQNATPSLQDPDPRLQAPIGHRQPRPSDLPPDVQRDEQLDPPSVQTQPQKQAAQTQPQKQTANRRAQAGSVPTIDVRKGCQASQDAVGSIFGPNNAFGVDSCLRQEQEACQHIINKWTTYPSVDKQKCTITTAYNPSYVEWITCLEVYRNVRMLRNTEKSVGAGTR